MNYEKQTETKYDYYLKSTEEDEHFFLLGVPKETTKEEANLFIDFPLIHFSQKTKKNKNDKEKEEFEISMSDFFKLNMQNRQIIYNTIKKLEGKEKRLFNVYYWDVIVDFIFAFYGQTIYDIACDINGGRNSTTVGIIKNTYDRLAALKNSNGNPRKETLNDIKEICAYYLITDDILSTGRGLLYIINSTDDAYEKYTIETIRKCRKNDPTKKLKDMIMETTGCTEKEIIECKLQVACQPIELNKDTLYVIKTIMNEMYTQQNV